MVSLVKSHGNIHGITYRIKIMLSGIAMIIELLTLCHDKSLDILKMKHFE